MGARWVRRIRATSFAAVLGLAAVLATGGCGFALRGQAPTLSIPGPVLISGVRPYSGLRRELARALAGAGVEVADAATDGGAVLAISRRSQDERVLSVNSRNKAIEYELEEAARFSLRAADGRELVAERTVRLVRIHFRPDDAILAADREAEMLRADMQRELAARIVRSLGGD